MTNPIVFKQHCVFLIHLDLFKKPFLVGTVYRRKVHVISKLIFSQQQGNIPDFADDIGGDDAPAGGEGGNSAPTIPSGGGAQGLFNNYFSSFVFFFFSFLEIFCLWLQLKT